MMLFCCSLASASFTLRKSSFLSNDCYPQKILISVKWQHERERYDFDLKMFYKNRFWNQRPHGIVINKNHGSIHPTVWTLLSYPSSLLLWVWLACCGLRRFPSTSNGWCFSSFFLDLHQTTQSFDLPIFFDHCSCSDSDKLSHTTKVGPSSSPQNFRSSRPAHWSEDCFYYCSERNNVVVLFGTLKVQSFILTEVIDCGLLIVVTSSTFLKRKDMLKEKSS